MKLAKSYNFSCTDVNELYCAPLSYFGYPAPNGGDLFPMSPKGAPQPLIPFLAPSPLTPFTNSTVPKLSGSD